jgi:hypothetical protein
MWEWQRLASYENISLQKLGTNWKVNYINTNAYYFSHTTNIQQWFSVHMKSNEGLVKRYYKQLFLKYWYERPMGNAK